MYLGFSPMNQQISQQYDPNGRFGGDGLIGDVFDGLGAGIRNWWYTITGQPHKTDSYKALQEYENTAYQRMVEDMRKAGLSPYFANGTGNQSSSSLGMGKVDPISNMANLQALQEKALDIKERKHNLSLSEKLGIRTGDQNYAAKWAEIGNVLFGFDPTKVEGGIIPYVISLLRDNETDSPSSGKSGDEWTEQFKTERQKRREISALPFSNVLEGVSYDQAKQVILDVSKLRSMSDYEKTSFINDLISSVTPSKLEDSLRSSQLGDSLDSAISHAVKQMKSKDQLEYHSIDLVADFLAMRYDKSKDFIIKRFKEML